jgi:hypothetical protein
VAESSVGKPIPAVLIKIAPEFPVILSDLSAALPDLAHALSDFGSTLSNFLGTGAAP